ncbi:unnamed protein product [Urochloa humidicola]
MVRAPKLEVCLLGSYVAAPQLQAAEGSSRTRSRRRQDIPEKIKKLLFEGEVGMARRLDYNDVHSVRIGQHKVVDGVTKYKVFLCANKGFCDARNEQSGSKENLLGGTNC